MGNLPGNPSGFLSIKSRVISVGCRYSKKLSNFRFLRMRRQQRLKHFEQFLAAEFVIDVFSGSAADF
jgi:hypothetical protein